MSPLCLAIKVCKEVVEQHRVLQRFTALDVRSYPRLR